MRKEDQGLEGWRKVDRESGKEKKKVTTMGEHRKATCMQHKNFRDH